MQIRLWPVPHRDVRPAGTGVALRKHEFHHRFWPARCAEREQHRVAPDDLGGGRRAFGGRCFDVAGDGVVGPPSANCSSSKNSMRNAPAESVVPCSLKETPGALQSMRTWMPCRVPIVLRTRPVTRAYPHGGGHPIRSTVAV